MSNKDSEKPDAEPRQLRPTVKQLFDLTGRVAMVTGGTGHLGQVMAEALAEAGANVVITSRSADRAEKAAQLLPSFRGVIHCGLQLDHLDDRSVERAFAETLRTYGRIDVLINNAHDVTSKDWRSISGEEFNRQLSNATGYFLLARLVREHAVSRATSASIVLLGSMYGVVGSYPEVYRDLSPASPAAYHALKGAIVHMARHLAVYWAPDLVRVNCLSPGPFPAENAVPELISRLRARCPMGRIGRPDELKGAVVFLASDASSYMTGQNLIVDGGWTAW
jgi:NAD(P)-dependent dehydrogenase (short-subunit alcohol dehydrogenase family)